MKRRDVIFTAAASIAASMLPLPALAFAPADVDYFGSHDFSLEKFEMIEQVNGAFNMVEDYQFTPGERARLFGFLRFGAPQVARLRELVLYRVIDFGMIDTYARVLYLNGIRRALDEKLGKSNLEAQLAWMDSHNEIFHFVTLRERLRSSEILQLHHTASMLGYDIDDDL